MHVGAELGGIEACRQRQARRAPAQAQAALRRARVPTHPAAPQEATARALRPPDRHPMLPPPTYQRPRHRQTSSSTEWMNGWRPPVPLSLPRPPPPTPLPPSRATHLVMLSQPPFFKPGAASSLTSRTGTSTMTTRSWVAHASHHTHKCARKHTHAHAHARIRGRRWVWCPGEGMGGGVWQHGRWREGAQGAVADVPQHSASRAWQWRPRRHAASWQLHACRQAECMSCKCTNGTCRDRRPVSFRPLERPPAMQECPAYYCHPPARPVGSR